MLWQDLLAAARYLRLNAAFTGTSVLTIAVSIGASATIFSFADALLLRPLPVPDADRVVHIYQRRVGSSESFPLAYADYLDYHSRSRSFETLAAHYPSSPMDMIIGGEAQAANGAVVTASYFELLKIRPVLGRFFNSDEDRVPGRDALAVISHSLWQRRFYGDLNVVGKRMRINGEWFTVIGVAPSVFSGVHNGGLTTDVWIPTAMFGVGYRYCNGFDRACTIVDMLGRLRLGVSMAQAQKELDIVATQLEAEYPATNRDKGIVVVRSRGRGYGALASAQRTQLQLFLVAVGLLLLIGCANVAGLLLASAIRRRKEMALRVALGATRTRLITQLLTESVLLAALGGSIGLVTALWAKDLLSVFNAADYAGRARDFRLDVSSAVIAATAGLTLLATVIFGLVPALQASRPDVGSVIKSETSTGSTHRARLRQALVVGQVALAVVLVIGAGLLMRSLSNVFSGPGFDPRSVITLRLRPGLIGYPMEKALAFQREVIARLEALPGVVSASPADGVVATAAPNSALDTARLLERGRDDRIIRVRETGVGPRFFSTLSVAILRGREFENGDEGGARVVVINDVLAREISATEPVTGRTLLVRGAPHEIVGVVKDAQYYAAGQPPHGVVYLNYWQPNPADGGFNKDSRTVVRVAGDAAAMMPAIRRAARSVDSAVPVSEDYPLSSRVAFEFQTIRMASALLIGFGIIALFLSAVGLYGVLAFAVSQRRREIGVRMALGANQTEVAALVVRHGLALALLGVIVGVVVAGIGARAISGLLFGVESQDATTFLVAPVILLLVALAAVYLPARRAASVSPLTAMRYE